ncbi:MAG: NADH:flavin oxidoreductase/NADH oxidase family protein [Bacteroidetes bacterium]|nr:NADH:flavin oxidoreductase/NADH oxidase family protein [Bacteroidota bacterium]MDA1269479.1 NADH:flavin oxidoreductase/NADH oxidase family protein [Bacteroidota bacterium]
MSSKLIENLELPCGATLKNRLGKSAMSENMGSPLFVANPSFATLYSRWAAGGAGLLLTGNVMVDSRALGEAKNVVIEKNKVDPQLKSWAEAGKKNGTHIWVQLNHPGKQSPKFLSKEPVAPSAIPLKKPLDRLFATPRALSEEEILEIIERFSYAAKVCQESGFTGVQIHGAHGYLVSQFLSPTHNQRNDQWGGSLENRMRFVTKVYQAIRKEVGHAFPVGIKLNSADFQKGGFTKEDSMAVVKKLSELGMDLIEISGGTYESPAMMGAKVKASTQAREAYFLDYCEEVRKLVSTPLMLTGGFRSLQGMEEALATGACDLVGLGRSIAIQPNFPNELLAGRPVTSLVKPLTTGWKFLDNIFPLEIIWYTNQLHLMGQGKNPDTKRSTLKAVFSFLFAMGKNGFKKVR